MTEILEQLCEKFGGWSEKDGDTLGHYSCFSPGDQLMWTVKWNTSQGQLSPNDILPIESMNLKQILVEVESILFSESKDYSSRAGRLLHERKTADKYQWEIGAKRLISDSRKTAKEFLCHWDLPSAERIIYRKYRPQWKPPDPVAPQPEPPPDTRIYLDRGPKKPMLHPGYWGKDRITAQNMDAYRQAMKEWRIEKDEWYEKQKEKVKK